jgi:short-subunit dehydrogenase
VVAEIANPAGCRWKTAWITGASTGIGRELALRLARRGCLVAASARSADKLVELAALDTRIMPYPLDVTRPDDVTRAHEEIRRAIGPVELAILNAGAWHPVDATRFDAQTAASSMAVNYHGITNALEPLIAAMVRDGRGQLALVASVAGYRGLPRAAAYAPGKAAVIALAEVLRLELARHDIVVQVVNPGFVETPMTAVNDFPMPYIMKPGDAADRILRGLAGNRFEVAFPWQLLIGMKLLRSLPYGLFFRVARSFLPRAPT